MKARLQILLGLMLACFSILNAQLDGMNQNQSRFFSFSPSLQTNGYGINLKWAPASFQSKFYFYSINFGKIKHPKEFRYVGNARYNGFVYGRKNVVLPIQLGIGRYHVLGIRNSKNDVGVAWLYQAGVSMAFLKPVYLYINENPTSLGGVTKLIKYTGETNLNFDNIVGGASFFIGLNQTKISPGAYGKIAVLFSWGKYYGEYHALELGFLSEIYGKALPMMANTSNSFFYPSFYLNMNWGRFW